MDYDIRWYKFLNNPEKDKRCLLNDTLKIEDHNIIVSQNLKNMHFAKFENHTEFLKYQRSVPPHDNCFYEVMTEKTQRKPYFDIDIKKSSLKQDDNGIEIIKNIKENIIAVILENAGEEYVKKAQLLVYTSHTDAKISYHIVVHGLYLKNHKECKNFFEKVSDKTEFKYKNYIDCSVYKTVQQLRILGSNKYFKKNTKVLSMSLSENFSIPERYLRFPRGKESYLLLTSLVGNITDCEKLPSFEYFEPEIDYSQFIYLPESDAERLAFLNDMLDESYDNEKNERIVKIKLPGRAGNAEYKDIEQVMEIFHSKYPREAFKRGKIIEHDGNMIIAFYRVRKTMCNVCKRIHYNENPYVRVTGLNRDLYFHCRREQDDKGELFGSLGKPKLEDVDVKNIVKDAGEGAPAQDILDKEAELHKLASNIVVDGGKKEKKENSLSKDLSFLKL